MEHRRSQRFSLCLPVSVTRLGNEKTVRTGLTRNISSGGVLFAAEQEPDLGGAIEYVIALSAEESRRVHIRCMGTVLRCEKNFTGSPFTFTVAATLERYEFVRPD